jgi:hypothetical protein
MVLWEPKADFNRAIGLVFSGKPIFFESAIVLNGQGASQALLVGEELPRSEPSDRLSWAAYCALACPQLSERSIGCNKTPRLSLIGGHKVNSGTAVENSTASGEAIAPAGDQGLSTAWKRQRSGHPST